MLSEAKTDFGGENKTLATTSVYLFLAKMFSK